MKLSVMQYFCWLRSEHGYPTRDAWLSTMMRYCCTHDDLVRRMRRGQRKAEVL